MTSKIAIVMPSNRNSDTKKGTSSNVPVRGLGHSARASMLTPPKLEAAVAHIPRFVLQALLLHVNGGMGMVGTASGLSRLVTFS